MLIQVGDEFTDLDGDVMTVTEIERRKEPFIWFDGIGWPLSSIIRMVNDGVLTPVKR